MESIVAGGDLLGYKAEKKKQVLQGGMAVTFSGLEMMLI